MEKIEVTRKYSLTGHKDCVYTLKLGSGSLFFSGAGDGMVVKWDLNDPDKGEVIAKVPTSIYALDYCKISDILVVGQNYDGIHVLNVDSKQHLGSLKLTSSAIFDIKKSGKNIYIGTGEGELVVVDQEKLSVEKRVKLSDKSLRAIEVDPLNRLLVLGFSDHKVRILDLDTYLLKYQIDSHTNSVFSVCFSNDYQYLLTCGRDAHLKVWNTRNDFEAKTSIVAHMYAINHIAFSPDNRYFATCSMDKSIKIWDAENFKLLKVIDKARHAGHGTSVNKLAWSAFNSSLISCSDDKTVSIWDIKF